MEEIIRNRSRSSALAHACMIRTIIWNVNSIYEYMWGRLSSHNNWILFFFLHIMNLSRWLNGIRRGSYITIIIIGCCDVSSGGRGGFGGAAGRTCDEYIYDGSFMNDEYLFMKNSEWATLSASVCEWMNGFDRKCHHLNWSEMNRSMVGDDRCTSNSKQ